ncbi:hypothetical protein Anapl_07354 [Anas platyrhynchos]|uniref:Uncharacterized protein n=1 Tax=Anas platyrhynchos TaxID=8839 RepID=R0LUB1_ANAPL|nr:hypothetical protein Anapl_07354 [Anas platyrhynchos]
MVQGRALRAPPGLNALTSFTRDLHTAHGSGLCLSSGLDVQPLLELLQQVAVLSALSLALFSGWILGAAYLLSRLHEQAPHRAYCFMLLCSSLGPAPCAVLRLGEQRCHMAVTEQGHDSSAQFPPELSSPDVSARPAAPATLPSTRCHPRQAPLSMPRLSTKTKSLGKAHADKLYAILRNISVVEWLVKAGKAFYKYNDSGYYNEHRPALRFRVFLVIEDLAEYLPIAL